MNASQLDSAIEKVEQLLAELRQLRGEGSLPAHVRKVPDREGLPIGGGSLMADDGFDMTVSIAAFRTNYPEDTIRYWCRTQGIGRKVGGHWRVSFNRLGKLLEGRR